MREWGELPAKIRKMILNDMQTKATRYDGAAEYCDGHEREHSDLAEALRAAIRVLEREGRK